LLFIAQTSDKQTEIDFQTDENELYSIVKPARIVGIFGHATLVTSIGIHAICRKVSGKQKGEFEAS
jgi:hypothetical protein